MNKENYRETLKDILAFTNGKRLLTIKDVCDFTKASRHEVTKRYSFTDRYIEADKLAREMC